MARITSDQIHSLYASLHPETDEKGNKKPKIKQVRGYLKLQQADIQNLSDEELMNIFLEYSEVSDELSNESIQDDIRELFSDQNQVAELRKMLKDNRGDMEYILNGYRKLGKVRKIEKEIEKLENQINEIKLKLYCKKKSLKDADRTIIARVQKFKTKIEQKKAEKERLLQTKEIVAAYELQKITGYADRLRQGKLVYTPSVEKNRDEVRNSVFTGQNILLTGPVGTGKTRLAIDIYKEILEEKKKNGEIDDQVYQKLSQLCVVNGNEDTSIRDIKSRPIQMSNKEGEENVFTYDEGLLTLCLKYGMPLIIDEANRTSPNFLSSLKKFWALKPGQEYKDEVTGETFKIKAPLQVILTSNEGQKYGKHTTEFQDQIERELERVHVGYMPENELYDLVKARIYEAPGIANVTEKDLQETLPHLINAVTEVNELYTSGKEYSSSESTSDWKLSSTVLDTKRFLQLIDRELIGSKETFWDELNQKIVEFIQGIKPSDAGDMDRKIVCSIFHKNGLLCKENIPDLLKGADKLTAHDLSTIVSSAKSQLQIPKGARFVNPWQFAKGYGKLENREGDVVRHRLANFENLDFENSGKLKSIAKGLRELNLLNPMRDGELIAKLQHLDESNLPEVLAGVGRVAVESGDEEKISDLNQLLEEAEAVVPGIQDKVKERMCEYCGDNKEESNKSENNGEGDEENSREIPQKLKDFRKYLEKKLRGRADKYNCNITHKDVDNIIKAAEKIPVTVETDSDGSRLIKFRLGNKTYKILDPNLKNHTDAGYVNILDCHPDSITSFFVKLGGMMGDDVEKWENEKLKEYVKQKQGEGLYIPTVEEMRELLGELGEEAGLYDEYVQIAMLTYLTGIYGRYWLSMGSGFLRSTLKCLGHEQEIFSVDYGRDGASLLMLSCS